MLPPSLSPAANVRRTSLLTVASASSVTIYDSALSTLAADIHQQTTASTILWDESDWHFTSPTSPEHTALYVLTLDALNFCFWPSKDGILQYHHIATALKTLAEASSPDNFAFSAQNLAALTPETLEELLFPLLPVPMPNVKERARLLNEMGDALLLSYGGQALNLIAAASKSADKLTYLIAQSFSGFRDTCVNSAGNQSYFYKRAQICVADLWAAFKHKEPCDFTDIDAVTTFADYRIPQLLRELGVMVYSEELATRVDASMEIRAGSDEEIEIRAATVVCVERLVKEVTGLGQRINAVQMDWWLWQTGEKLELEGGLKPHHKVKTIFY